MDHNQERRRGHFHRGRRGPDRRGADRPDRRNVPAPEQSGGGRDHVDVEQIMRDIRARIAQRHGIDLSTQQIQDLAARRLEAILDPRSLKPGLLDELRRSAGTPPPAPASADATDLTYAFEDTTLYESSRGILRFVRKLLNPILKLFFNPNPLIRALNIQARWNAENARQLAERDRHQTEWNALHYELVHRMVLEVSRVSLELQHMSGQLEALSAKVDFNDRRVRSMEAATHQARPAARSSEPVQAAAAGAMIEAVPADPAPETAPSEGTRRRRRRRRGRRGGGAPAEGTPGAQAQAAPAEPGSELAADLADDAAGDDEPEEESTPSVTPEMAATSAAPATAVAPAFPPPPESAQEPAPIATVTPEPAATPLTSETHTPQPASPEATSPPGATEEQREPQG